jgi:hypothetical protein
MDYVYIRGTVDAHNRFTPDWWSTPPVEAVRAMQVEPSSEGCWITVALDKADQVLARASAPLVAAPICPEGSRLELSALLALPDTTSAVAILDGDREVFRRTVPNPSRVNLDECLGTTPRRGLIEVLVHINGPDPQTGAYIVPRWEAPGQPALPLGLIDVGTGQPAVVRLDLTELPGGEGCRLSVIYFDGIRTVNASSEPLSVKLRPAVPVIEAPNPETQLFDDTWLSLEGCLEGDGDPEGLQWLIDGELVGTGARAGAARPRAGTHTVTLQYGTTARTSIEIMVLAAPTEDIQPPPWAPPWRSRPFRFVSTL